VALRSPSAPPAEHALSERARRRPVGDPTAMRRLGSSPTAASALVATLGALVYLITAPPSADLAAATYRSDLFGRVGLSLWDNGWYAGHHLPGYSLLSPALGAVLGPRLLLVLSAVLAAALFGALAARHLPGRGGMAAALWFAVGISVELLSGRVPYYLGLALALAALTLWPRHRGWALAAAALASGASPVAGAFLALVALALAVTSARPARGGRHGPALGARERTGWALGLGAAALLPALALTVAFPEGGYEPFSRGAFWPALAGVVVVGALLAPGRPALATGSALYALAMVGSFALSTPVGGNVTRLGSLVAGPLMAGLLWDRRPRLLAVLVPALAYWQLATPLHDLAVLGRDPAVGAGYFRPVLSELERRAGNQPTRVEVPFTGAHWESVWVAQRFGLTRGWERQLDTRFDPLFYGRALDAGAYRRWLVDNAVSWVAVPDARLDDAGRAEVALVDRRPAFLREVWHSTHWRLYAMADAAPLVSSPARMSRLGSDTVDLALARPATVTVRVHYTPYWALLSGRGCVSAAPGGWTQVYATSAGALRLGIRFGVERIVDHGPRCR